MSRAADGEPDALQLDRLTAGVGQREPRVDALADLAVAAVQLDGTGEGHEAGRRGGRRRAEHGVDAGRGDARVRRVAAELAHERLDVGDPGGGAVRAVGGGDGVDGGEAGAVVERAAQAFGDAGDRLVPGGEVARRPRGSVEPVERVVRAHVAVLRVEVRAEARLGAGDGDKEDGVDAVRRALGDERGAAAGHRRRVLREEGVDLRGVGSRRGRRREYAGQGGGHERDDDRRQGDARASLSVDADLHQDFSLLAVGSTQYSRVDAERRPGKDAVPGGARQGDGRRLRQVRAGGPAGRMKA